MTKTDFLSLLKNKLSIIEENELNDILNEYEQHIEMKVQNDHVTEEEAIKDFGDIKELVADILESYHVKADYEINTKEEKHSHIKENAKEFGVNTKNLVGGVFSKSLNKIKSFFKKCSDKVKSIFKLKTREKEKEEVTDNKKTGKFISAFKKFIKNCIQFLWKCIIIVWNLCIIGFIIFVACFGLIMLYISGTALVMLVQKYPMWGILIVSISSILFCGAVILGLYLLIKQHKVSEKKRNIKIAALGMALAGVLFGGIGTGIGFVEFTSFSYGGEKVINQKEGMVYESSVKIPMENIDYIYLDFWIGKSSDLEIIYDDKIPFGVAECEITDNTDCEGYMLDTYEDYEYDKVSGVHISAFREPNTVKEMMALKDSLVEDIKNREFSSYRPSDVTSIKLFLNPSMNSYIKK